IARGELLDGAAGSVEVGVPAERASIPTDDGDVQLRLDVLHTPALELQVAVPGRERDRAVEDRVDVVENAGESGVFDSGEAAGGLQVPINGQDSQAQAAEIGLQNEAVMAGADNDAVECSVHPLAFSILLPEAERRPLRGAAHGSRGV